jgi:hypothetical protein
MNEVKKGSGFKTFKKYKGEVVFQVKISGSRKKICLLYFAWEY